jgi:hypothetical protein
MNSSICSGKKCGKNEMYLLASGSCPDSHSGEWWKTFVLNVFSVAKPRSVDKPPDWNNQCDIDESASKVSHRLSETSGRRSINPESEVRIPIINQENIDKVSVIRKNRMSKALANSVEMREILPLYRKFVCTKFDVSEATFRNAAFTGAGLNQGISGRDTKAIDRPSLRERDSQRSSKAVMRRQPISGEHAALTATFACAKRIATLSALGGIRSTRAVALPAAVSWSLR